MQETIVQATEAVAETIPQVTEAVTEVVEVATEVAQAGDYAACLEALLELSTYQTGFLLFFVVVILCYFSYKFLRIFF